MKLYEKWWSSTSHSSIPTVHLGLGARLLSLANARPFLDGIGVLVHGDGSPMSTEDLANACRVEKALMGQVIRDLMKAGTIERYPNGMLGFPNMMKWQESPAARRMKRFREKKRENPAPRNMVEPQCKSDAPRDGQCSADVHTENPLQVDLEHYPRKGNDKVTSENPSGLPVDGRNSDAQCSPTVRSQLRTEDRGQKVKNGLAAVPLSSPPGPSVTVTPSKKATADKARVDATARVLDHWWCRYTAIVTKARRKPTLESDAAAKIKARLREGWEEQALIDAIDGAFITPWNLGEDPKTNGKRYLALTTILRSHSSVTDYIDNLETFSKPRPNVSKSHNVKGTQGLHQWSQVQDTMEERARTRH